MTEEEHNQSIGRMIVEIKKDVYHYVDTLFMIDRENRKETLSALKESQHNLASHTEFYISLFISMVGLTMAILSILTGK